MSNRADVERVRNERHNIHYRHGRYAHATVIDDIGVRHMNELVTLEHIQKGIATEVVFDLVEDYKTAEERMAMLKTELQKLFEQYGIKGWETDCFKFTYIGEAESAKVDTKRMKDTNIYIMNGSTGELEEVNAYEFFSKKSIVKAHVTYKEKK